MDHHVHHHEEHQTAALDPTKKSLRDYTPLLVVLSVIFICSATYVLILGNTLSNWMMALMGYFFIFFSLFKLIDLTGFAEGFAHYDIIAMRVRFWGYIYPFVELSLGVLYLLNSAHNVPLYLATIMISAINVVSVAIKLAKKEAFMCACLGTVLKVPLTTVALIEYAVMGLMAVWMLLKM
jgi:small-conductance mechanosensitive channel